MNVMVAKVRSNTDSVPGVLFITLILIILKLSRALECSWWIITSPAWFSLLFGTFVLFIRDNARKLKGDD